MKNHIILMLLIVVICMFSTNNIVCGEESSMQSGAAFKMESSNVKDTYQINVALPLGYDEDSKQRYSVAYILDGNWNSENARRIAENSFGQGDTAALILVSVCPIQAFEKGYQGTGFSRCRDLTPTHVKKYPGSGDARLFAEFLKTELIPYIDQHYRTIPMPENRCLIGHSFGGLFAYYMLFNYNDTFRKFMAFSPSIWWDKRVILKYEEDYARDHTDLHAQLYTTVGGRELFMVGNYKKMVRQLEGRHYPGLTISSEVIKGAKHVTNWNPSFEHGLKQLFGN